VFGFGAKKTPMPFVNACSRFLYLENLGAVAVVSELTEKPAKAKPDGRRKPRGAAKADAVAASEPAVESPSLKQDTAALKQDARLVSLLRNAVESAAGEDGWSALGAVGQQIGNQASFDQRNYGYATLTKLLAATDLFELIDEGTSHVSVREKPVRRGKA